MCLVFLCLSWWPCDIIYFVGLKVLGTCEAFEEKPVGNERYNIFSGCPLGRIATIIILWDEALRKREWKMNGKILNSDDV